ncbi:hypothetical protein D9611_001819 [Ephemerocybe angulata]|uniref:Replication factor C subunit 5 n=1 Tax=Ephemerocybe angulata TaxID=980116 RepID=A0A8H5CJF3_9AGAR|nr:hypothetical protein D9611_001819 [Tulosesus angulatus]
MSLWVDQSASGDFPHMLFYGPSGAGKKTRISCTLRQLFGPGVEKLKIDQRIFLTPSKRKMEINIVQSNFHIEITPRRAHPSLLSTHSHEAGNYDRLVIQEILKEIAQTQQVDLSAKQRFKVVIINEADSLSRDAQAALRRTMEKYMSNMRIILCANSTSRLIAPIRSRCLLIRVAAPNTEEMASVLDIVARRAGFTLPEEAAQKIVDDSGGNLRKAILVLEALKMQSPDLNGPLSIAKPDWEIYCHKVADMIIAEQSPAQVMLVRTKLYELLSHCIPPTVILKTVADRVVDRVDEAIKADVMHWAAFYEVRMRVGSKKIFHLEAWVVKVMSLYKASMRLQPPRVLDTTRTRSYQGVITFKIRTERLGPNLLQPSKCSHPLSVSNQPSRVPCAFSKPPTSFATPHVAIYHHSDRTPRRGGSEEDLKTLITVTL